MTRTNSSPTHSKPDLALAMGFCTNAASEADLIAFGIPGLRIWNTKREGEGLDWVIASDRDRHMPVYVAENLTCFGEGRDEIFGRTAQLEKAGIPLRDIRDLSATMSALLKEVQRSLSASNGMRDKRTARKRGRLGGHAKAVAAQAVRQSIAADWFLKNLAGLVPVHVIVSAAENKISASSFRRHYIGKN